MSEEDARNMITLAEVVGQMVPSRNLQSMGGPPPLEPAPQLPPAAPFQHLPMQYPSSLPSSLVTMSQGYPYGAHIAADGDGYDDDDFEEDDDDEDDDSGDSGDDDDGYESSEKDASGRPLTPTEASAKRTGRPKGSKDRPREEGAEGMRKRCGRPKGSKDRPRQPGDDSPAKRRGRPPKPEGEKKPRNRGHKADLPGAPPRRGRGRPPKALIPRAGQQPASGVPNGIPVSALSAGMGLQAPPAVGADEPHLHSLPPPHDIVDLPGDPSDLAHAAGVIIQALPPDAAMLSSNLAGTLAAHTAALQQQQQQAYVLQQQQQQQAYLQQQHNAFLAAQQQQHQAFLAAQHQLHHAQQLLQPLQFASSQPGGGPASGPIPVGQLVSITAAPPDLHDATLGVGHVEGELHLVDHDPSADENHPQRAIRSAPPRRALVEGGELEADAQVLMMISAGGNQGEPGREGQPHADALRPEDQRPIEYEYEVDAIMASRIHEGQKQYLLRWKGMPESENTWEDASNLTSCKALVRKFEILNRPPGLEVPRFPTLGTPMQAYFVAAPLQATTSMEQPLVGEKRKRPDGTDDDSLVDHDSSEAMKQAQLQVQQQLQQQLQQQVHQQLQVQQQMHLQAQVQQQLQAQQLQALQHQGLQGHVPMLPIDDSLVIIDRKVYKQGGGKKSKICKEPGCTTRASLGRAKGEAAERCSRHKLEGDVVVYQKLCEVDGCLSPATVGAKNRAPLRCDMHKQDGDVKTRRHLCEAEGCLTYATFGPEHGKRYRCAAHRQEGDIDAKHRARSSRMCEVPGCSSNASFGPKRGSKLRCAAHRVEGDVNGKHSRLCEVEGCTTNASFGPEKGQRVRCAAHRADTDSGHAGTTKVCEVAGCTTVPSCGPKGGKRVRCSKHRLDNDVTLYNKLCSHEGCQTIATFGPEKGKKMRCFQHRIEGDIDVQHKMCEYPGCQSHARFGPPGGKWQRCSLHKHEGDINLYVKLCGVDNCPIMATYGPEKGKKMRCSGHRLEGDVNVHHKLCGVKDCLGAAKFGPDESKRVRCAAHKLPEDVKCRTIKKPRGGA